VDRELAKIAGVDTDLIGRDDPPTAERLDDLGDIVALLIREAEFDPHSIVGWLRSRNRTLDWQRPLEVLRLEGYLRLVDAVDALLAKRGMELGMKPSRLKRWSSTTRT